ncbi:MAG: metallophosphoesterase, partial [Candidatus Obscuribacterales bacterium]|nr:metallophosphoesterase [Candidatus Obscuribacterales bacterium]
MKLGKFFEDPRNRNIALASVASLAVAGLGTYLYASRVESRRYRLDSVRVNTGVKGDTVPEESDLLRLKILHISDLHLSSPESHKLEFLRKATEAQYDLIVITGDIFENYSGLEYASKIIARPPRLGAFAVLGNHDYYEYNMLHRTIGRVFRKWRAPKTVRDVTPMVDALEQMGIKVLRNSSASFPQEKLHIVGIDYPGIKDEQLNKLVAEAGPDNMVIALLHVPDRLDRLHRAGIHLAFGGHTHGGQVRLPFWGPLITNSDLPRHEASGLIWRGATAIHVSRGLGADPRTNFRLFCPPHGSII